MKIGVIGTGNVGSVLGTRLGTLGHEVSFFSRSPESDRSKQLLTQPGVVDVGASIRKMVEKVTLVIYAAPFEQAEALLKAAGDFSGAVLIDCTNPLNQTFDGLIVGHNDSAGERFALWSPSARVVKAFNTTSVATMANPSYGGQQATQFYCGDDVDAKQVVAALIQELGMEPVDAGPLLNARYLEATAMLYIHLAVRGGWGGNCALKMLRRI